MLVTERSRLKTECQLPWNLPCLLSYIAAWTVRFLISLYFELCTPKTTLETFSTVRTATATAYCVPRAATAYEQIAPRAPYGARCRPAARAWGVGANQRVHTSGARYAARGSVRGMSCDKYIYYS